MLDITAEEAIKLVVSAGIVSPAIATRLEAEQEKDVKEQES